MATTTPFSPSRPGSRWRASRISGDNGLPREAAEVLSAATYGGALAMGLQEDIGSVEPGKLADLVILNADPGIDIRNCRQIDWVIKGGTAYRPQQLTRPRSKGTE